MKYRTVLSHSTVYRHFYRQEMSAVASMPDEAVRLLQFQHITATDRSKSAVPSCAGAAPACASRSSDAHTVWKPKFKLRIEFPIERNH